MPRIDALQLCQRLDELVEQSMPPSVAQVEASTLIRKLEKEVMALYTAQHERDRYERRAMRFRKALRWIAKACDAPGRCTGCGKPNGIRAIKTHAERAIRGLE